MSTIKLNIDNYYNFIYIKIMNNDYLVSVVVPVYKNAMPWLRQTIASILAQTHQNLECILVINGAPTTGERECCAEFAARDKRVKIYDFYDAPCSTGLACQKGNELASGKYFAIIGHDDGYYPEFIAKLSQFLENNHDYSFVGSFVDIIDEHNFITAKASYPITNEAMIASLQKIITPFHCYMMPMDIFRKMGGYELISIGEDDDIIYKAAKFGKLHNIPEFLFAYRKIKGRISASNSQNKFLNFIHNINSAKQYFHGYKLPLDATRRLNINYLWQFAEYENEKIFVLSKLYQIFNFPTTNDAEKSEIKIFFNDLLCNPESKEIISKIIKQPKRSEFLMDCYRLSWQFGQYKMMGKLLTQYPTENFKLILYLGRIIRKRLIPWIFYPPYLWGRMKYVLNGINHDNK